MWSMNADCTINSAQVQIRLDGAPVELKKEDEVTDGFAIMHPPDLQTDSNHCDNTSKRGYSSVPKKPRYNDDHDEKQMNTMGWVRQLEIVEMCLELTCWYFSTLHQTKYGIDLEAELLWLEVLFID